MTLQWYPGHMTKARRELGELLPSQDMVIEVIDARLPMSSQNPVISSLRGDKPCIKVLTRSDLADPIVTEAWLRYFNDAVLPEGAPAVYAVAVSSERAAETRSAIGALVKKIGTARSASKAPRALIAGVPNVGKSTLINTLMNRAVAAVSNRPAVTKEQQKVTLPQSGAVLTDTPGLMNPNIESPRAAWRLALAGSIPDTAIEYTEVVLETAPNILARYGALIQGRFKLEGVPDSAEALLEAIGRRRGFLRVGGVVDRHKAAEVFVHEFRAGKLGRISLESPDAP